MQYLFAVLADCRRAPRDDLLLAGDPEWAVDGPCRAILERHQRLGGEDLGVLGDLVHVGDNAEDETRVVEYCTPLGLVLGREDLVENNDQLARMRLTGGDRGETGIVEYACRQTFLEFLPTPLAAAIDNKIQRPSRQR